LGRDGVHRFCDRRWEENALICKDGEGKRSASSTGNVHRGRALLKMEADIPGEKRQYPQSGI